MNFGRNRSISNFRKTFRTLQLLCLILIFPEPFQIRSRIFF